MTWGRVSSDTMWGVCLVTLCVGVSSDTGWSMSSDTVCGDI